MKEESQLADEKKKESQTQYIEVEYKKRRKDDLFGLERVNSNFPKLYVTDRVNDGLFKFDLEFHHAEVLK